MALDEQRVSQMIEARLSLHRKETRREHRKTRAYVKSQIGAFDQRLTSVTEVAARALAGLDWIRVSLDQMNEADERRHGETLNAIKDVEARVTYVEGREARRTRIERALMTVWQTGIIVLARRWLPWLAAMAGVFGTSYLILLLLLWSVQ